MGIFFSNYSHSLASEAKPVIWKEMVWGVLDLGNAHTTS